MSKAPIEHLVACWRESQPDPAILGQAGWSEDQPCRQVTMELGNL